MPSLADVTAIVLAGGLGTRLQSVTGDLPKPMVPVGGRPFLEHLLEFLARAGVVRVVLALGYRADVVERHFRDGSAIGLDVTYQVERQPLGTGGAIGQAAAAERGRPLLVLNGDSFLAVDLRAMLGAHVAGGECATLALARVSSAGRFGLVEMGIGNRVLRFSEKSSEAPGFVNAGIYLLEEPAIASIPDGASSFEHDTLPALVAKGVQAFPSEGYFVDIGVPADYRRVAEAPEEFLQALGEGRS